MLRGLDKYVAPHKDKLGVAMSLGNLRIAESTEYPASNKPPDRARLGRVRVVVGVHITIVFDVAAFALCTRSPSLSP